jgi:hypothetical protein
MDLAIFIGYPDNCERVLAVIMHDMQGKQSPSIVEHRKEGYAMYVSRLTFHTLPGKTQAVEHELQTLKAMVDKVGGLRPRVLHNHFASLGAPDVVFEQDAPDLETLEVQIKQVTDGTEFKRWTEHMSGLLAQSPKREVYLIVE